MFCKLECVVNGQQFKQLYEKKCEPLMDKYTLKKVELEILFFLDTYKTCDTAKDIVTHKNFSKAHVSKAIESLTEKQYVTACTNKDDRRCVHLGITKQAEPILSDMHQLWEDLEQCIYQNITEEEKKNFFEVLDRMIININDILERE